MKFVPTGKKILSGGKEIQLTQLVQRKPQQPSNFSKIKDLACNAIDCVSSTFNSLSETISDNIPKSIRPFTFLATLACSTAISSSLTKTSIDACKNTLLNFKFY